MHFVLDICALLNVQVVLCCKITRLLAFIKVPVQMLP